MKNEIISALLGTGLGFAIGGGVVGKRKSKEVGKMKNYSDKHLELFLLMNQWVKVKQEGKNLSSYFEKNKYKKIAIYGMSYAGEALLNELKNSSIIVAYGIDKNANGIYSEVDIFSIDEVRDDIDAIVVTAVTYFDEIESMLREKVNCPIVSLEDVIYEV